VTLRLLKIFPLNIFIHVVLELTPVLFFSSLINIGELRFRFFRGGSYSRKAAGKSIPLKTTQVVFGSLKDLALLRWQ
jgi:hypothetical protein